MKDIVFLISLEAKNQRTLLKKLHTIKNGSADV
ncbi:hypothetical protein ABIE62_000438 [Porphyrobacter sp. MBR-155]